jgi:hypothetical protein
MSRNWLLPALMLAGFASGAHAVVIADSKFTVLQGQGTASSSYTFTVVQAAAYDDYTSIWVDKRDGVGTSSLVAVDGHADIGSDYYLVRAGDQFTPENIAAGQFQTLYRSDYTGFYMGSVSVPLQGDFYLGIATTGPDPYGQTTWPFPYPSNRNVWGWAHFSNSASGLTLLGSAVAYGEPGIVVGTLTAVPEADSSALMALGLLGVAGVVRAKAKGLERG